MDSAMKISFLLLLFGSCKAGVLPVLSPEYYQTHAQQSYFTYPDIQETYNPYYYNYNYQSYPDFRSYPYYSMMPYYNSYPMTYGYYPIPVYDFQINIVRLVPDGKGGYHPLNPKAGAKPGQVPSTTAKPQTTPQTMTEIELSDPEFDEDTIEKLDTKIIPQTSSEEVMLNTETESITVPTDMNDEVK